MSLSLLLIPFFLFLFAFALFAISAIFHIIKFELLNFVTIFATIIFGVGTLFIATISASYISKIDWQERITFDAFSAVTTQQPSETGEANIFTF